MLSDDPEYRRLKIGGHGALGSASYWVGKGHLLMVVVAGYLEKYQRFQYRDIQALMMRKTRVLYILGFGFAALAIGLSLGAFAMLNGRSYADLDGGSRAGFLILSMLALACVGLVITNALLGPTCVCHLRTALQTTHLPQLNRWKKAQRLFAELSPLVIAAQPPEQSSAAEQPLRASLPPADNVNPAGEGQS